MRKFLVSCFTTLLTFTFILGLIPISVNASTDTTQNHKITISVKDKDLTPLSNASVNFYNLTDDFNVITASTDLNGQLSIDLNTLSKNATSKDLDFHVTASNSKYKGDIILGIHLNQEDLSLNLKDVEIIADQLTDQRTRGFQEVQRTKIEDIWVDTFEVNVCPGLNVTTTLGGSAKSTLSSSSSLVGTTTTVTSNWQIELEPFPEASSARTWVIRTKRDAWKVMEVEYNNSASRRNRIAIGSNIKSLSRYFYLNNKNAVPRATAQAASDSFSITSSEVASKTLSYGSSYTLSSNFSATISGIKCSASVSATSTGYISNRYKFNKNYQIYTFYGKNRYVTNK